MRENAAAAAGTRKLGLTPALTEFLIEARSSTGEMTKGQEDRTGGQNKATAATAATALETEEGTPVQTTTVTTAAGPPTTVAIMVTAEASTTASATSIVV